MYQAFGGIRLDVCFTPPGRTRCGTGRERASPGAAAGSFNGGVGSVVVEVQVEGVEALAGSIAIRVVGGGLLVATAGQDDLLLAGEVLLAELRRQGQEEEGFGLAEVVFLADALGFPQSAAGVSSQGEGANGSNSRGARARGARCRNRRLARVMLLVVCNAQALQRGKVLSPATGMVSIFLGSWLE